MLRTHFTHTHFTHTHTNTHTHTLSLCTTAGDLDDFSAGWYTQVGTSLLMTMIVYGIAPHVYPTTLWLWRREITSRANPEHAKSQRLFNARFLGPAADYAYRWASHAAIFACSYLFATGLPLMNVISLASYFLAFWADKLFFTRLYRTPRRESTAMAVRVTRLIPLIVGAHLALGAWMVSYPPAFPASSSPAADPLGWALWMRQQAGAAYTTNGTAGQAYSYGIARLLQPHVIPYLAVLALLTLTGLLWTVGTLVGRSGWLLIGVLTCGVSHRVAARASARRVYTALSERPSFSRARAAKALIGIPNYNMLENPLIAAALTITPQWARSHRGLATLRTFQMGGVAVAAAAAATKRAIAAAGGGKTGAASSASSASAAAAAAAVASSRGLAPVVASIAGASSDSPSEGPAAATAAGGRTTVNNAAWSLAAARSGSSMGIANGVSVNSSSTAASDPLSASSSASPSASPLASPSASSSSQASREARTQTALLGGGGGTGGTPARNPLGALGQAQDQLHQPGARLLASAEEEDEEEGGGGGETGGAVDLGSGGRSQQGQRGRHSPDGGTAAETGRSRSGTARSRGEEDEEGQTLLHDDYDGYDPDAGLDDLSAPLGGVDPSYYAGLGFESPGGAGEDDNEYMGRYATTAHAHMTEEERARKAARKAKKRAKRAAAAAAAAAGGAAAALSSSSASAPAAVGSPVSEEFGGGGSGDYEYEDDEEGEDGRDRTDRSGSSGDTNSTTRGGGFTAADDAMARALNAMMTPAGMAEMMRMLPPPPAPPASAVSSSSGIMAGATSYLPTWFRGGGGGHVQLLSSTNPVPPPPPQRPPGPPPPSASSSSSLTAQGLIHNPLHGGVLTRQGHMVMPPSAARLPPPPTSPPASTMHGLQLPPPPPQSNAPAPAVGAAVSPPFPAPPPYPSHMGAVGAAGGAGGSINAAGGAGGPATALLRPPPPFVQAAPRGDVEVGPPPYISAPAQVEVGPAFMSPHSSVLTAKRLAVGVGGTRNSAAVSVAAPVYALPSSTSSSSGSAASAALPMSPLLPAATETRSDGLSLGDGEQLQGGDNGSSSIGGGGHHRSSSSSSGGSETHLLREKRSPKREHRRRD